jgi:hypothetical protein
MTIDFTLDIDSYGVTSSAGLFASPSEPRLA